HGTVDAPNAHPPRIPLPPHVREARRNRRATAGPGPRERPCEYEGGPVPQIDTVIRSRRVVAPKGVIPASVGLRGGGIAVVCDHGTPLPGAAEVDLGGVALLPGLVDADVAVHAPGQPLREGYLET